MITVVTYYIDWKILILQQNLENVVQYLVLVCISSTIYDEKYRIVAKISINFFAMNQILSSPLKGCNHESTTVKYNAMGIVHSQENVVLLTEIFKILMI